LNVKTSVVELWFQHLRLSILKFLLELRFSGANESLLLDALRDLRIKADRSQVREALAWLAERNLIKIDRFGDDGGLMLAEITELGIDVALGDRQCEGVRPPSRKV